MKDHQIAELVNRITKKIQPLCPEHQSLRERVASVVRKYSKEISPDLIHVWGGHGEGGLYINGKKVSDYYTCGQAKIIEALGFEPEAKHLDEAWYTNWVVLPENLSECKFS